MQKQKHPVEAAVKGYYIKVTVSVACVLTAAMAFADATGVSPQNNPDVVVFDLTKILVSLASLAGFIIWWANDRKAIEIRMVQNEESIKRLAEMHKELKDSHDKTREMVVNYREDSR